MNNKATNILEELDLIADEVEENGTPLLSVEDVQKDILESIKNENLLTDEVNSTILDPKNDKFISIIKENVKFCVDELKEVNTAMNQISNQKNTELFFRKSENIKLLSQYMSKVASVNQKTLDLLILLLGATSKISENYDTILSTIDELGHLNNGEAEVLSYLIKVKKMVFEIRDNDLKIKQVVEDNQKAQEIIMQTEERIKEVIKENKRSRKTLESRCVRLQRQLKFNNLYIGACLLLVVLLAIFIMVKFYVL